MRSVVAVLAGFILWPALWLPFNFALAAAFPQRFSEGVTSHPGLLLLTLLGSLLFSLSAGWLTARIAGSERKSPPMILAVIQLAVGLFVQVSYWDLMPIWYHVPFLLLIVPGILTGAHLNNRLEGVQD